MPGSLRFASVGEGLAPIHSLAAVGLLPHQAGGAVGDGAVTIVVKIVPAVGGVAADVTDIHQRIPAAGKHFGVSLDAPIGEVDAKDGGIAAHCFADVWRGGPVLAINDTDPLGFIAVGEVEVTGCRGTAWNCPPCRRSNRRS